MGKPLKASHRGLKILSIVSFALFIAFFIALIVFGILGSKTSDVDLKDGIGGMFSYHFSDIGDLFAFKFHSARKAISITISSGLYFFIFIAILCLIFGILLMSKKKSVILLPAVIATFLTIVIYIFLATGSPKYWGILNQSGPFENDHTLIALTFIILALGIIYFLLSFILYIASVFAALKMGAKVDEKDEENGEQNNGEKPVLFEAISEDEINGEIFNKFEHKNDAKTEDDNMDNKEDLKALLQEIVRDIVRDEIARNNANQTRNDSNPNNGGPVTGATFGGPLVVQYFNGGIQGTPVSTQVAPEVKQEEVKQEEPAPNEEPANVSEEAAPENEPVPEADIQEPVKEEPVPEAKADEIVVPVEEAPNEEKKPIIRIPFTERMLNADKEMQDNYNELKNEILSYGVNSRVSNSGDTFRLHRKTYVKITIAGLSLKLYFALNPDDYKDSTLPIQNAGHKGIYEEIPLVFKVKSGLSMRRCKQLIQDVFDKNGLEQGEIANTNWVEELKNAPSEESDED